MSHPNEWDPKFTTFYRASRAMARHRWRGRRARLAEVRFAIRGSELTVIVGSCNAGAAEASWRLIGILDMPDHTMGRQLHMEVISHEGKYGFLVRLVKRLYAEEFPEGVQDHAEYVFRVARTHPILCDFDPWEKDRWAWTDIILRPCTLAALVRYAHGCTVILGGTPIAVSTLYYRGLHPVDNFMPGHDSEGGSQ